MSTPFPGVTNAFRNSTEFKDLSNLVRIAYPTWPEYLVETAIVAHITNPRLYREAGKNHAFSVVPVTVPSREGSFNDSVNIYEANVPSAHHEVNDPSSDSNIPVTIPPNLLCPNE